MATYAQTDPSDIIQTRKAVLMLGDKILLLKINPDRTNNARSSRIETWDIPGGKVWQGESDADTLRREVRESTCLEIDIQKELNRSDFSPEPGVTTSVKNFICKPHSESIVLNTLEGLYTDYRWVQVDKALTMNIPADLKKGLSELKG